MLNKYCILPRQKETQRFSKHQLKSQLSKFHSTGLLYLHLVLMFSELQIHLRLL